MNSIELPQEVYEQFVEKGYERWLMGISNSIFHICIKENLEFCSIDSGSKNGIVAHCLDKVNSDALVIKIFPPTSLDFLRTIEAQQILKYSFLIRAIRVDYYEHYYITKKVRELKALSSSNLHKRLESTTSLFRKVELEYRSNACCMLSDYWSELISLYEKILRNNYSNKNILRHYEKAIAIFRREFSKLPHYNLHGDLHHGNIMGERDRLVAIDPLGTVAPVYFEFPRFIENEIFRIKTYSDFSIIYDCILTHFSRFVYSRYLLHCATYIDSIFRTSSSIINNESKDIVQMGINNACMLLEFFKRFDEYE